MDTLKDIGYPKSLHFPKQKDCMSRYYPPVDILTWVLLIHTLYVPSNICFEETVKVIKKEELVDTEMIITNLLTMLAIQRIINEIPGQNILVQT